MAMSKSGFKSAINLTTLSKSGFQSAINRMTMLESRFEFDGQIQFATPNCLSLQARQVSC